MPEQPRTCQWCQRTDTLIVVCKSYATGHKDGPFRICEANCLMLAEGFGYLVLEQMEATR